MSPRLTFVLLIIWSLTGAAQIRPSWNLNYTGEVQTDFRRASLYQGLLTLGGSLAFGRHFALDASVESFAATREPLLDDLQGYSNIAAPNTALSLANLSLRGTWGGHELTVGVGNMNAHYFASPLLALYTNSSCGAFPTVAALGDVPNYPLSSLGLDYVWAIDTAWTLQAALFDSRAYSSFRMFRRPRGAFALAEVSYTHGRSNYHVGAAVRRRAALWAYAEQQLSPRTSLLAEASYGGAACRQYYGLGLAVDVARTTGALHLDYADQRTAHEWAAELTWHVPLSRAVCLQPTLHGVLHQGVAGMMRVAVALE